MRYDGDFGQVKALYPWYGKDGCAKPKLINWSELTSGSMVLFARDIVEKEFIVMPRGATVLEAARNMRDSRHGFVVIGTRAKPEGIVTEWDVLSKVVADGKDPSKVKLEDIMSTDLVSVKAEDGIAAVSQIMSSRGVRRVLVMSGDEVVGVITSKTVLARLKEYVDRVSAQISRLQTPWF